MSDLPPPGFTWEELARSRKAEIAQWQASARHDALEIEQLKVKIEQLTKERDFARDAAVQKCRQYETDMEIMRVALGREIEARRALENEEKT